MSYIREPQPALIRRSTASLPDDNRPLCDEQHYEMRYLQGLLVHPLGSWLSARFLSFLRQELPVLPTANTQYDRRFQSATNTPRIAALENPYDRVESPSIPTRRQHNLYESPASNNGREARDSLDLDPRKVRHDKRKEILKETLAPVINPDDSTTSSILLCWGSTSNARIWPIKVSNPDDETGIWQDIHRAWYIHRGWWRKHIPLLDIKEVEIGEIAIAGSDLRRTENPTWKNRYVGMFMKDDICAQKKRLKQVIDNYQEQEYPCPYNLSTGCPEKSLFKAQRDLEYLNLRSERLKFAFTQPHSAAPFDILRREHAILSHLDILGQLDTWHCPELAELRFPGLMIREGLEFNRQYIVLPLSVTVFFILVVTAKLVYGDWQTAWTVGGFLVALATLLWMWIEHFISR